MDGVIAGIANIDMMVNGSHAFFVFRAECRGLHCTIRVFLKGKTLLFDEFVSEFGG
jgi:hypothetical protein